MSFNQSFQNNDLYCILSYKLIFLSSCLPLDPAVQLDVLAVVVDVVAPGDRHGHDGNGDLIKVRMTMIMKMM